MTKRLFITLLLVVCAAWSSYGRAAEMRVHLSDAKVTTMSNGLLDVTIDEKGRVKSCVYDGTELVSPGNRWYLSYNSDRYHELGAATPTLVTWSEDQIEVLYVQDEPTAARWSMGYILRKNVSGLYTYVVVEGTENTERVGEARLVYRLDDSIFHYGYVCEALQGEMPSPEIIRSVEKTGKIQDVTFHMPDGSIYTKYNWSAYMRDDHYHGIMSEDKGVWAMSVSREYVNGGPAKQDIMLHSDAKSTLLLQMFQSGHFGAGAPHFQNGMKKIYGPCFLYMNKGDRAHMVRDAEREAAAQEAAWPFQWFKHELYPLDRATVSGTVRITGKMPASRMRVVLAKAGNVYNQGDDYIFWSETDKQGRFTISSVRKGAYALHAYAIEGENTDELVLDNVTVDADNVRLGTLRWTPVKHGTLLWRIGEADRQTDGFGMSRALRDYANAKQAPDTLHYYIGKSRTEDWFFVQPAKSEWTIHFPCGKVQGDSVYLTGSVAAQSYLPVIKIEVNGTEVGEWVQWECHTDPAVYRSATQGGYHQLMTMAFPAALLHKGENTLVLRMPKLRRRGYGGLMWDCLKMEIK